MDAIFTLNTVLHPIGMACASLVITSILGLAIINSKLANRMTVRLIATIAFTDLLAHVGEYVSITNVGLIEGSAACTALNGFRLFARAFYCFTNIAICFHLYRGLVLLKKSTWKFEIITYIATLIMVIIVTIIYWALGAFNGEGRGRCSPVTVLICIATTIICHHYLNNWINKYASSRSYQGQDQNQFKKDRKKMATRSFLYPLSTCITLPFEAIGLILNAFGVNSLGIFALMLITTGLSGILTFIAFALDPAAHNSFISAYHQLSGKTKGQSILDNSSEVSDTILLEKKI